MKFFYLICFLFLPAGFVSAQETTQVAGPWSEDIFSEDETDIACPDLPSAFNSYIQNVSAGQETTGTVLLELERFLQLSQETNISQEVLIETTQSLENQSRRIMQDQMSWTFQYGDITYFTEQCLHKKASASHACKKLVPDLILYNQDITVNQSALAFILSYVVGRFQELQKRSSFRMSDSALLESLTNARSLAQSNQESLANRGLELLASLQTCL